MPLIAWGTFSNRIYPTYNGLLVGLIRLIHGI